MDDNDPELEHYLTDSEVARLEATANEHEWNAACDDVKRRRGGQYPREWHQRVLRSGLMARAEARWEREERHDFTFLASRVRRGGNKPSP